ncbi:MAG: hypothetical protein ACTH2Q_21305 [Propionibacteriaceae bacterium]
MTRGAGAAPKLWAGFDRRGVLALLCCLVLVGLTGLALPGDLDLRRRYIDIGIGESASTSRWAAVTVTEVEVGTTAQSAEYAYLDPITTDLRFVAVTAAVAVQTRSAMMSELFLETSDGHRYEPRRELINAGPVSTDPGFTCNFAVVFEVPPERVPGAVLLFDGEASGVDVYRETVRVDLALTDPTAGVGHDLVLPEQMTAVTR